MPVSPFAVSVPAPILDDLHTRLERTRWTGEVSHTGWEGGTDPAYLKELVTYWREAFDWRAQETRINRFAQYRADVDGIGIHFVHERGKGPRPLPIVLTHGYPDSFLRFEKLIPLLTDPASHGGEDIDAFDVVVPSLPGYAFSDKPAKPGMLFKIADVWARLMMHELGYPRFVAHGGDWGSFVTEHLARDHADAVIGIHLTDVPFAHLFQKPSGLSATEEHFIKAAEK